MSEFHDPDLRNQLGQISGPYPDDNEAFAAWQRRVGQARRRRAVAWTTGAALSLLFGTVAVAALHSPGHNTLVPGKADDDSSVDVSISSTTEAEDSSTVESTEPDAIDSVVVDTTPVTEVVETSVPETEVEATIVAGDGGGSNSGPSKQHGTPTSAAPTPATAPKTFSSAGGSITVAQNGEQLTIVAINPASGFHAEEDQHSGRRVEVTFKSNDNESQISVRVVNGTMQSEVSDKGNKHDNTVPDSSESASHTSGDD
jgi:hypothetical protein